MRVAAALTAAAAACDPSCCTCLNNGGGAGCATQCASCSSACVACVEGAGGGGCVKDGRCACGGGASWAYYSQCDPKWSSQELGTCSKTICEAGCAMSSVSMILKTLGVPTDPGALDHWLTTNGGYASGCEIVWGSVDRYGKTQFGGFGSITESNICAEISKGSGLVANVHSGRHWVLLTGCSGGGVFTVNDPGYNTKTYSLGEISNLAVYHRAGTGNTTVVPVMV
mmetsp:Transcript_9147/g.21952  ORF Transcript_9147/g.21952 Transcript_9147/m.21952 type:complete len:226 (+) Transcript_9147:52-729(+)